MGYKGYDSYKESGVERFGGIPEHWKKKKLKYITECNSNSLSENTSEDYTFRYIDIGSIDNEKGEISPNLEYFNFKTAPSRARRKVLEGDTIISTVRTYLKAIGYIYEEFHDCIVSTGFAVLTPKTIDKKFLYYALRNEAFISQVTAYSTGVSYPAINASQLISLEIVYPSIIEEQKLIADFLDKKIKEIEKIIDVKIQQIETLQRYRQSLISEAVTRGLDPAAKMKDSGLRWVGKTPIHWDEIKLKNLAVDRKDSFVDGPFGSDLKTEHYIDFGIPIIQLNNLGDGVHVNKNTKYTSEEKADSLRRSNIFPGEIVISKMMPVARAAIVNDDFNRYLISSDCIKFIVDESRINKKFLVYSINSKYFRANAESYSTGSTRLRTNLSLVKNFKILYPPIEEQVRIAEYLDRVTSEIDELVSNIKESIQLFIGYRQSLIYEAITGKFDVRQLEVKQ